MADQELFAARLGELMLILGAKNKSAFARRIGVSDETMRRWRNPQYESGPPDAERLAPVERKLKLPDGVFLGSQEGWQGAIKMLKDGPQPSYHAQLDKERTPQEEVVSAMARFRVLADRIRALSLEVEEMLRTGGSGDLFTVQGPAYQAKPAPASPPPATKAGDTARDEPKRGRRGRGQ